MMELSLGQKIILRIRGYVGIGSRKKEGWSEAIPHYAFKCPDHGIVVDYPRGFDEQLSCPVCVEDSLQTSNQSEKQ